MSQLVRFSCARCQQGLHIDSALCGRPVVCPDCSATQVVRRPDDDDVPMRLSLPGKLGIQTKVSKETANTSAKVLTGALCTALGVVTAVLVGKMPRT